MSEGTQLLPYPLLKFFDLHLSFLCACLCTTHLQCPQGPAKDLDVLGQELWMVVSCPVGARDQARVLWKLSQRS